MTVAAKKRDLSQLSAFIAQGHVEQDQLRPEQRGIPAPATAPKEKASPTRKRFTVNLDLDLIEQARNVVANTLGVTLSGLVEDALRKELAGRMQGRGAEIQSGNAGPRKGRPVVIKG